MRLSTESEEPQVPAGGHYFYLFQLLDARTTNDTWLVSVPDPQGGHVMLRSWRALGKVNGPKLELRSLLLWGMHSLQ